MEERQISQTFFPILDLPIEILKIIAFFLDDPYFLNFRLVNNYFDFLSRALFLSNLKFPQNKDADAYSRVYRTNGIHYACDLHPDQFKWKDDEDYYVMFRREYRVSLTKKGEVLSKGENDHGQLGIGNNKIYSHNWQKLNIQDITKISICNTHALALTKDGKILAWGSNTEGQLGLGNNDEVYYTPKELSLVNVVSIEARDNHSFALTNDAKIYFWGSRRPNHYPNDLDPITSDSPIPLSGFTDLIDNIIKRDYQRTLLSNNAREKLNSQLQAFINAKNNNSSIGGLFSNPEAKLANDLKVFINIRPCTFLDIENKLKRCKESAQNNSDNGFNKCLDDLTKILSEEKENLENMMRADMTKALSPFSPKY